MKKMNGKEEEIRKRFGSLKVGELKSELRKRKAVVSGKKADLFERLVWFELNSNFVTPAPSIVQDILKDGADLPFETPGPECYRDVNSNSTLPPFTQTHINSWESRFFAKLSKEKGLDMYKSHFLLSARCASGPVSCFLRGECKAQMRKSVHYTADVELKWSTGEILGAHCECAAGSGDRVHCKHVFVLLFGIEQLLREKIIILHNVCTQQLQTFNQPSKQYFGTPLKAECLPKSCGGRSIPVNFFPVAPEFIDMQRYQTKVRNLVINYCASHPKENQMPIKTTYRPANPYGIMCDHDYGLYDMEELCLRSLNLLSIDENEVKKIEMETRDQASSKLWFDYRKTRMTASKFYDICASASTEAKQNLAHRLINSRTFTSEALQHGRDNEPKAIRKYEENHGVKVKKCGFFISCTYPYLGASPDGYLTADTIVEVKCPFTAKELPINHHTVPFLKPDQNGNLGLDVQHAYYFQIQGQLMITGASLAKLLIYTEKDFQVFNVCRDDVFIGEMAMELEQFFVNYFKPALLEKYCYKNFSAVFK